MADNDRITRNDDGTITYALKFPVSSPDKAANAATLSALTFRRAKAKDFINIDGVKGNFLRNASLMEALSIEKVPLKAIKEMDAEDFIALDDVMQELSGKSQATGGPS